ncbi:MlaD family protein [Aromatoleum diolicum]|uniref:MCE family protein n=1 Tax=Aromatoleum diolicum TaxID=75796 RepID=A0ABX1QAR0_9RHOO|nr:MlaD family protein [Aromatoleum diolicum]NMG74111.1 MCE family protein [Aromatoleum diolicum]
MENRAHALAAGLFALILGAMLLGSLWWFSDGREAQRSYLLESHGSVTGLNIEAQVRYRGIPAGKVSDIRIDPADPRKVLVQIRMRSDIPLTRGTRATLAYQGVTGLAYVQLDDRGENPEPLASDGGEGGEGGDLPRLTLQPGLMEQLTDTTLDTMRRLKLVSDRITGFFNDENIQRLSNTLQRLESAAAGADRTFADAPATLASIRAVLAPENLKRFSETLANLEHASADAAPAVTELRSLMTRLHGIAERLDTTTTAAGDRVLDDTLPQLNGLLKELTTTSQRMGHLIDEVDASPQMLLLGRTPTPPGPGESGFDAPRP